MTLSPYGSLALCTGGVPAKYRKVLTSVFRRCSGGVELFKTEFVGVGYITLILLNYIGVP